MVIFYLIDQTQWPSQDPICPLEGGERTALPNMAVDNKSKDRLPDMIRSSDGFIPNLSLWRPLTKPFPMKKQKEKKGEDMHSYTDITQDNDLKERLKRGRI